MKRTINDYKLAANGTSVVIHVRIGNFLLASGSFIKRDAVVREQNLRIPSDGAETTSGGGRVLVTFVATDSARIADYSSALETFNYDR